MGSPGTRHFGDGRPGLRLRGLAAIRIYRARIRTLLAAPAITAIVCLVRELERTRTHTQTDAHMQAHAPRPEIDVIS